MNLKLNRANKSELTCAKPLSSRKKFFLPEIRRKKKSNVELLQITAKYTYINIYIYI
jgi:hypothetical protein